MSRPLLVLRPEPEAQATAARAAAMGLDALVRPLFAGIALPWTIPDGEFDALMLTSANAIRFAGPGLSACLSLRVFAVGSATGDAARAAGFAEVDDGSSDVDALLMHIGAEMPGRILYLAAREARAPQTQPLFDVVTVRVYAMDPLLPPALPPGGVALIHSTRAGARFAEIAGDKAAFDVVAISANAASGLGPGWRSVQWPAVPTDAAMLALAAPLCEG